MADSVAVQLVALRKTFGTGSAAVVAVDHVDLTIRNGEFFSMLGPSGSGKTTVLRMIAGFEMPTAGAILLDGHDVTKVPAYERDVNTVFQDYALFPHMSVQENVEYGLRVKKVPKTQRRQRAAEMLEVVRLGNYGSRRPSQLSGGQRQRIALARALVNRPKVLLLDEPLGALDLKLREEMQTELKTIQHEVGITFIFVTHDQGEALSMSDRVAVFSQGSVEQVGTPREIYERPASTFVAGFVGTSNILREEFAERVVGRTGLFTVRPEHIALHLDGDGSPADRDRAAVSGLVRDIQYLGAGSRVRVATDDGPDLVASVAGATLASSELEGLTVGSRVTLTWPPDAALRVDDPSPSSSSPPHQQPGGDIP